MGNACSKGSGSTIAMTLSMGGGNGRAGVAAAKPSSAALVIAKLHTVIQSAFSSDDFSGIDDISRSITVRATEGFIIIETPDSATRRAIHRCFSRFLDTTLYSHLNFPDEPTKHYSSLALTRDLKELNKLIGSKNSKLITALRAAYNAQAREPLDEEIASYKGRTAESMGPGGTDFLAGLAEIEASLTEARGPISYANLRVLNQKLETLKKAHLYPHLLGITHDSKPS